MAIRLRRSHHTPARLIGSGQGPIRAAGVIVAVGVAALCSIASAVFFAPQASARPGLETAIEDDAQFLARAPHDVVASMLQVRALGIDRVRLTARWSDLTRRSSAPDHPQFDASDPAAYDQSKWFPLDFAVRTAHALGLKVMIDIGFWAPKWAGRGRGRRVRRDINANDFAQFAHAVALRYSGHFVPPHASAPSPHSSASTPPGSQAPAQAPPDGNPLVGAPPPLPLPLSLGRSQPRGATASDSGPVDDRGGPASDQTLIQWAETPEVPLPQADTFTLWNEPNHPAFLMPQWRRRHGHPIPVSPRAYRSMVIHGYPAIKAAQPDATVLVGNTSCCGRLGAPFPVPALRFLRSLACVDKHLRPLHTADCRHFHTLPGDGWAHHPYGPLVKSKDSNPDDVYIGNLGALAQTLDRLVAMKRLAPEMRSIYVTEFGYETHPLKDRPGLSPVKQARYLTEGEYLASRVPAVKLFSQFLLRDQPPASTRVSASRRRPHGQFYSGLEYSDGSPKLAMRTFVAGLFVQRAGANRVMIWGRLRLGAARESLVIERRSRHGAWRQVWTSLGPAGPRVPSFTVPGQDSFLRYAQAGRGGVYRLSYRSGTDGQFVDGLPVPAVG